MPGEEVVDGVHRVMCFNYREVLEKWKIATRKFW